MTDSGRNHDADQAGAAFAAAQVRARRAWRRYLIVIAVVVVVLGAAVLRIVQTSEIEAVSMKTTRQAAKTLPTGVVPATLSAAWTTSDHTAVGNPSWNDVVITYSQRSVTGRDASTGTIRWQYTRKDRLLCTVDAQDGIAIAIYAHDGLCDEVTGLNAVSGQRSWSRTLLGTADADQLAVSSSPGYLLISMPDSVELLQPGSGLDFWYNPQNTGCTTISAVLGTGVGATVKSVPETGGVLAANRCASGDTLALYILGNIPTGGTSTVWSIPRAGQTPLSVDGKAVALGSGGRTLNQLDSNSGAVTEATPLRVALKGSTRPLAVPVSNSSTELATVSGAIIAFDSSGLLWQRSGRVLPRSSPSGLLTSDTSVVITLDPNTGTTTQRRSAAGLAGTSIVFQLGLGVIAAGATTTVYR
jgi:hypothetical protein